MPFRKTQHAFSTGEVSRLVHSRDEVQQISAALRTMQNFIPLIQGAAQKRSGTKFIFQPWVPTGYGAPNYHLIPFHSPEGEYMLLGGNGFVYICENRQQLADGRDLTITNIDTVSDEIEIGALDDNTPLAGPCKFTTTGTLPTTVPQINTTDSYEITATAGVKEYHVYPLAGGPLITFSDVGVGTHSITRNHMESFSYSGFDLKYAQSEDSMYFARAAQEPFKLIREDADTWTVTTFITFINGPWVPINQTEILITVTATVGTLDAVGSTVTLTASGPVPAAGFFQPGDAGKWMRIYDLPITGSPSSGVGVVSLPGVVGAGNSIAGCTIQRAWQNNTGVAGFDFNFGLAWTAARGYPACVMFHEQRLFYAGEPLLPQTLRGSETYKYENFSPSEDDGTVVSTNAVEFTLNSDRFNSVKWMLSSGKLYLGTDGGIFSVDSASDSEPITPTSIDAKRVSSNRSNNVQPVGVDSSIVFTTPTGTKVVSIDYEFAKDKFIAEDLTLLAEHLSAAGVVQIAFQQEPVPSLWVVCTDGSLLSLTIDSSQKVRGWTRHVLGGSFSGGAPVVETVGVLPGPGQDDVWLVVKRTIDGATVRTVEIMERLRRPEDPIEDSYFVDCGIVYDGAPTTTITGLDHLEGETVDIFADGAVVPPAVVTSGQVTLSTAASKVSVGLNFVGKMQTLPYQVDSDEGSTNGIPRRIHKVIFHFLDTVGGKFGRDFSGSLSSLVFRRASDPMDSPVSPFSGYKEEPFPGDYDEESGVCIQHDDPSSMTLLSLTTETTHSKR